VTSSSWARRRDLLAEWVRLSEKQVKSILAGGEPDELQALLLAKDRLAAELGRLDDLDDGGVGAADAAEALELARRAQQLDQEAAEALAARLDETRTALSGLGEARRYVRSQRRPPARFIDRYE